MRLFCFRERLPTGKRTRFMAITADTIDEAITEIQDSGQSFSLDGITYTAASLSALIELRNQLRSQESRTDGTRPLMRRVKFGSIGY